MAENQPVNVFIMRQLRHSGNISIKSAQSFRRQVNQVCTVIPAAVQASLHLTEPPFGERGSSGYVLRT